MGWNLARLASERSLAAPESTLSAVETGAAVSFLFYLSVTALAWPAYCSSQSKVAKTSEQASLAQRVLIHFPPAAVSHWKPRQASEPGRLGPQRLFAGNQRGVAQWLCVPAS